MSSVERLAEMFGHLESWGESFSTVVIILTPVKLIHEAEL